MNETKGNKYQASSSLKELLKTPKRGKRKKVQHKWEKGKNMNKSVSKEAANKNGI